MKGSKQEYRVGIGASTMLTIFVVLCVATLALLALSGARGDAALTGRTVEMTADYYGASHEAQRVLARLDAAVAKAAASAPDDGAFQAQIAGIALDGVSLAYDGGTLSFELDAGGGRILSVAVRPSMTGERCPVIRYQLTGGELWSGESGPMNLFN